MPGNVRILKLLKLAYLPLSALIAISEVAVDGQELMLPAMHNAAIACWSVTIANVR